MLSLAYIILGLILFAGLYFGADAVLSRIKLHPKSEASKEQEITVYVLSNGVHTDIVLPIRNAWQDWTQVFPIANTKGKNANQQYMAVGWGDKGFYLNTPEWKDLTLKTALIAGFGIGETALHITYYSQMQENELCFRTSISSKQYQILRDYILNALDKDAEGNPILIETNAQYGLDDAFYEAKGAYNLFFSCNTWTNRALKKANMPSGVWTVFDKGVLRHY
ncbi:TIGR02117 family protein [Sphingobacterium humi]|uniref:TIGR02117 family protein n=2 Tax=Sphingobacterium humi TaxID=1796905 RepID=A0A6N8L132_9SPHI|nr:TIGR02117 family protein [Sphingobacterium humi]